jgi:hypothetical protein
MTCARQLRFIPCAALLVLAAGCGPPLEEGRTEPAALRATPAAEAALARELARLEAAADSIDTILHPLPLLRPAQEAALRRATNPQQLQRARALGIDPGTPLAELERFASTGRLVRLPDSTRTWVIRELDYSVPYLTPDAAALLTELGDRFQQRLARIGLPPFRLEVTSILRDRDSHARLRQVNPNAAAGESTHQFGTTLDVAYNAYAAPAEPIVALTAAEAPWLEPYLERIAVWATETIAARRSAEIQAILGEVLIEMQNEGKVLVIMERLQPVYHMTVARRLAAGGAS